MRGYKVFSSITSVKRSAIIVYIYCIYIALYYYGSTTLSEYFFFYTPPIEFRVVLGSWSKLSKGLVTNYRAGGGGGGRGYKTGGGGGQVKFYPKRKEGWKKF